MQGMKKSWRNGESVFPVRFRQDSVPIWENPLRWKRFQKRDKLEEIEKYAVPDETGILYEDRWYFVEREYQKPSWKTYLAEMEQTDSVQQVRKSLQGYITQRRAAGGMRKDFTVRFIGELVQTVYGYLKRPWNRF